MFQYKFLHWFDLIELLVKSELKIRYRNSFLGYLWSMLNPLLTMSVLAAVFTHAMRVQIEHYPAYILSGLLCWNVFSQSCQNGVGGIVGNAHLLKKVKVPAWVFPSATIGSAGFHMLLAIFPYVLIALYLGVSFSWQTFQLFPLLILYFIFIQGVILTLGSLNVFFRDIGHVLEPILQLGFYATPVLYTLSVIPEGLRFYLKLNPIYYYLSGFRACLFSPEVISPKYWAVMLGCSVASLLVGIVVYKKSERKFLYYV